MTKYLTVNGQKIPFENAITPLAVMEQVETAYPVYLARFAQRNIRLDEAIEAEGELQLLDIRDPSANMAYQNSLILLYLKAVRDELGDVAVTIANPLSKGLYTTIRTALDDDKVSRVYERMKELAEMDLPFVQGNQQVSLADYIHPLSSYTVPSTGHLKMFELRRFRNGVLLRFPHILNPAVMPEFEEQRVIYEAFAEELHWQKITGIHDATELNKVIEKGELNSLILLCEALHDKKITEIAAAIRNDQKRLILIAGPSSSGKTSFAKRLIIQLRVLGLKPLYLGTDDYFVNREDMIPDENGKLDFESLDAVDIELFEQQMNTLLAGGKADIPTFDFIEGKKVFGERITSVEAGQPIVVEGIHALNPKLTGMIAEEEKCRIYICPLTQLNLDAHHRVPTTDGRLLRRIARDERTRGYSAETTLKAWRSVREGEEVNVLPYSRYADMFFNSHCLYELPVLKRHVYHLLKEIPDTSEVYCEAQRMLDFLDRFADITDDSAVAVDSILREFIGGSVLVG
ncbi:MAG: nucleoside kinase [Solobacterium sp.]|nr:nucleoside kinase [Solobacterium sp.]